MLSCLTDLSDALPSLASGTRRRSTSAPHDLQLLQPPLEQVHLVVGVGVLGLEVLVLLLQLPQLVGDPVLYAGGLGLDLFGVGQPELSLKITLELVQKRT